MINFHQLRAFYEAARTGSFTRAAEVLCVTQPAVTGQIRALEQALELRLFRRRGRRMVLTEAGALLYQRARQVFELERDMERLVAELKEVRRGLLKVGTTKTYARYLMPGLVRAFHAAHPEVRIVLEEGSSLDVIRGVLDQRNELAVVGRPREFPGLVFVPFRREEVVLLVAPGHRLARAGRAGFRDLAGELLILKEEGSSTRNLVREAYRRRGMTANVLVETSNLDFIKDMVGRGEGISFLVRCAVEEDLAAGTLVEVPLEDGDLYLDVYIVYQDREGLSPAARAFLGILEGNAHRARAGARQEKPDTG